MLGGRAGEDQLVVLFQRVTNLLLVIIQLLLMILLQGAPIHP